MNLPHHLNSSLLLYYLLGWQHHHPVYPVWSHLELHLIFWLHSRTSNEFLFLSSRASCKAPGKFKEAGNILHLERDTRDTVHAQVKKKTQKKPHRVIHRTIFYASNAHMHRWMYVTPQLKKGMRQCFFLQWTIATSSFPSGLPHTKTFPTLQLSFQPHQTSCHTLSNRNPPLGLKTVISQ